MATFTLPTVTHRFLLPIFQFDLIPKHLQTKCIHDVFTTLQVEFVAEPAANKAVKFQHVPELYHNPNHKDLEKEEPTGFESKGAMLILFFLFLFF